MEGGMLWFNDLTIPDPYYGLPIVCCAVTLALVEYGISMTGEQVGWHMSDLSLCRHFHNTL